MENTKITFEFLEKKHVSALVQLYDSIFNKKVEESYFETKYGLSISGQKQYSVVGMQKGQIIGFFGALPHEFQAKNESYFTLFTCDYFLLESYRGKGIFDQIYSFFKDEAIRQNVDFLYTFDSAQTHKFGQRMGWQKAPSFVGVEWVTYPKTIKSIQERVLGSNWSQNRLEKFLTPYRVELTNDYLPRTSLVYDDHILQMKNYGQRFFIQMKGCYVWMKYDYRLTIGFIQVKEGGNLETMLKELQSIAKKSGVHQIVTHLRPEDLILNSLKSHGSAFSSYNASYLPLKKSLPDFESFTTHFIHGDMF